jgi:hypothetical protein
MQLLGCHGVLRDSLDQGRHQRCGLANPTGQCCAIEIDPLARIDAGLSIERQMIIAKQLNIGIDSLVFVDDNPVERARIRQSLPMVAVPELATDPGQYVRCLADAGTHGKLRRGNIRVQANSQPMNALQIQLPICAGNQHRCNHLARARRE